MPPRLPLPPGGRLVIRVACNLRSRGVAPLLLALAVLPPAHPALAARRAAAVGWPVLGLPPLAAAACRQARPVASPLVAAVGRGAGAVWLRPGPGRQLVGIVGRSRFRQKGVRLRRTGAV